MLRESLDSTSTGHLEAEVVIVGYGGAGAAAAITAHDAGAKVTIAESMSRGGGNTLVSMGGFLCPKNPQDAIAYISALYQFSHSDKDEEVIRVFSQESVKNVEWVKGLRGGRRSSCMVTPDFLMSLGRSLWRSISSREKERG